ncbi:MAG: hypothetical protein ACXABY_01840 [Candidatus Thorarchaeota archaeon]|jgi:hypothetical protein
MYPLPPELSDKLMKALYDACLHPDEEEALYNRLAVLLVRENRRMRQQVAHKLRGFAEAAERHDGDYGAICAAAGGEEVCKFVIHEVIKPNVYFDSQKAKEQQDVVERLIQDFFEEDDDV